MPPVLGPTSSSPTALWSSDEASSARRVPSHSAIIVTSRPVRRSSMTTVAPASPNARSASIARTAAFASAFVDVTTTPLPAASPSAFTTTAPGCASMNASAAPTSWKTPNAAVGTPASRISRFA
jgi:hypothetical protein